MTGGTTAVAASVANTRSTTILCADDYALSAGVSRAIVELALRRRISATSALVTPARWPKDARDLLEVRDRIAVGLHVNLTLGAPLGPMPSLAADGRLPSLRQLVLRALLRRVASEEIAVEVTRQLDRFQAELGFAPDHVDGHQHVHALPGVRDGFLAALRSRFPGGGPLVRDPSPASAAGTAPARVKGAAIAALSRGFARDCRASGFTTNGSFSGVSSFSRGTPFAAELAAALQAGGRGRHLVMCHPGHADAELSRLDPVVMRREDEYAAMMHDDGLPALLWHPDRAAGGPAIEWSRV